MGNDRLIDFREKLAELGFAEGAVCLDPKVDGKEVARQSMGRSSPLILQWDENFDIGADTGTPVSNDYQVPFRFTGKLGKLTLTIDHPQLSPEDAQKLMLTQRNNRASE